MNDWQVIYTKRAEQDLRDIYEYIAFTLLEPEIAKKQINRITDAVNSLSLMPMRHTLYEKEPWHSEGLRFLPIGKYILFYLPLKNQGIVSIVRIMYGGRDITKQL